MEPTHKEKTTQQTQRQMKKCYGVTMGLGRRGSTREAPQHLIPTQRGQLQEGS